MKILSLNIMCFIKSLAGTVVFLIIYSLFLGFAHFEEYNILLFIFSIVAYFYIAQKYIEYIQGNLWEYLGEKRVAHKLTASLGLIEQTIYAASFVLEQYSVIGIWFGIKIASRLISSTKIRENKDYEKEGQKRNAYLIGNVVALMLGIMVGIIIKDYWKLHYASSLNNIKSYLGLIRCN